MRAFVFWLPLISNAAIVCGATEAPGAGSRADAPDSEQVRKPVPQATAERVVALTNEFRRQESRAPVAVNGQLREAARDFARYIADHRKMDHEADGNTPATRARKHAYDYCIIAENLAYEYSSAGFTTEELARSLVEGWKHSPEHRKNLLQPDVTETGVAVAGSNKPGYYYAVQMFARPKSLAIHFRIENRSGATIRYETGGQPWSLSPRQTRSHQGCTLDELKLNLSGKEMRIKPGNRDRYTIVQSDAHTLQLKKE
ncbi:MAG TPA: CAP domain-containing protein [Burkholderiales bacterium]|nr:CAP domain-containing protein [Burkholderiales bacterium]